VLAFQPSLDALSLRSDVISSITIIFLPFRERGGHVRQGRCIQNTFRAIFRVEVAMLASMQLYCSTQNTPTIAKRWFELTLSPYGIFFFFFTLVAGRKGSLSLKLSDTRVYAPQIRARLVWDRRYVVVYLLICSLSGSLTVMSVKGVSTAVILTLSGLNPKPETRVSGFGRGQERARITGLGCVDSRHPHPFWSSPHTLHPREPGTGIGSTI